MNRSHPRPARAGGVGILLAHLAALALLLALPAGAGDEYPAPRFYDQGLTAASSWPEILKRRSPSPSWLRGAVYPEFPLLAFGPMLVSLPAVCAEGEMLRIADPRLDNGVRISIRDVPRRATRDTAPSGD